MERRVFEEVIRRCERIVEQKFTRNLRPYSLEIFKEISKGQNLVYLIHGIRGSGKTTLLSYIRRNTRKSIFVSGDILSKFGVDLLEFMEYAYSLDYRVFLIDEVHYIEGWERDMKIFYDEFEPKIVVSGSSSVVIHFKKSELSRRVRTFQMKPLSFREYIYLKEKVPIRKVTIKDLLDLNKREKLMERVIPYLHLFDVYLFKEALPAVFFTGNHEAYWNILEKIVESDLLTLKKISYEDITDIYRMIRFLATSPPGEISYTSLSSIVGRSKKYVSEIIKLLELSGLIYIVSPYGKGHKGVRGEDKILFPLSFRAYISRNFGQEPNRGSLREDFFVQHVGKCNYLKERGRKSPDYIYNDIVFEVGGPSKKKHQIAGRKRAYLVKESVVVSEVEIPIYLFGLLY